MNWNETEKDIIDGGKTIPYATIKKYPEAEKEFIRRNKDGHQFPTIQKYACGEYTVRSVLSMWGKDYMDVNISNQNGVSIEKMRKRLAESGIKTEKNEKATYEDIKPKAIVYYPEEDHWVAVERAGDDAVTIHDSNFKKTKIYGKESFLKKWLDGDTGFVVNTYM